MGDNRCHKSSCLNISDARQKGSKASVTPSQVSKSVVLLRFS